MTDNNDKSFLDRNTFAKQLAQALREADERQQQQQQQQQQRSTYTSTSSGRYGSASTEQDDTLIYDTYQILCHDDPTDVTVSGGYALFNNLLQSITRRQQTKSDNNNNNNSDKHYALSNRLVNGIQYKCSQYKATTATVKATTTTTTTTTTTNSAEKPFEEDDEALLKDRTEEEVNSMSLVQTTTLDSNVESGRGVDNLPSIYSLLAWIIHFRIPLECLVSNSDTICHTLLGSFVASSSSGDIQQQTTTTSPPAPTTLLPQHHPLLTGTNDATHNNNNNNDLERDEIQNGTNGNHAVLDIGTSNNITNGNNHGVNNENNDLDHHHDDDDEVWAAESDPSDYEYESEYNPIQQLNELENWAQQIQDQYNPTILSQPPTSSIRSWEDIRGAVSNLISNGTYPKLSTLSYQQWQQYNITDSMIQLILVLLLRNDRSYFIKQQQQDQTTDETTTYTKEYWQQLGIQVLHVFRDATIDSITKCRSEILSTRINTTTSGTLLEDYIQLSCTLVKVYENTPKNIPMTNYSYNDIPPATWVGVSALSSMCSEILHLYDTSQNGSNNSNSPNKNIVQSLLTILQTTIEQNCDELNLLLEISLKYAKTKSASTTTTSLSATSKSIADDIRALQWSYLAFFQLLSKTTSTSHVLDSSNDAVLPNNRCQTLLNSGLFRQLLLCWEGLVASSAHSTSSQSTNPNQEARLNQSILISMQDSIFDLCVGSPNLIGKYVWRFPKFANYVTTLPGNLSIDETSNGSNIVSRNNAEDGMFLYRSFLWNLLGIRLSEDTTTSTIVTPTIKWKTTATTKTTNKPEEQLRTIQFCTQHAQRAFDLLCQEILKSITDWKLRREHNLETSSNITRQKQLVYNFEHLICDIISPSQLLQSLFHNFIRSTSATIHAVSSVTGSGADSIGAPNDGNATETAPAVLVELQSLKTLLQNWPTAKTQKSDEQRFGKDEGAKDNDDTTEDKKVQYSNELDVCVGKLRKTLKIISSLVDNNPSTSIRRGTYSSNSKVD